MTDKKKGTDAHLSSAQGEYHGGNHSLTPKQYSRILRLCPSILIIGVIVFLIAYSKQAINVMYFSAGIIIAAAVMEVALNPIEEEDEEDGNA